MSRGLLRIIGAAAAALLAVGYSSCGGSDEED